MMISTVLALIFTCQSLHSPFDPNYQQGSEIYVNIYYNVESQKASVSMANSFGPSELVYKEDNNNKTHFSNEDSTGLISFNNDYWESYVSMVYLGKNWGMATSIPINHPSAQWRGQELELLCYETENTNLLFVE